MPQPFWLTADFQALDIPGTNLQYSEFVRKAGEVTRSALSPVRVTAQQAQSVHNRLKSWYTDQIGETVAPIQEFTNSAAGFIEDVASTGVHVFVPFPDFGGFNYVNTALQDALVNVEDDNRPRYSDDMYAGGVLLMAAGGRVQMLMIASTFITMMGGNPEIVNQALAAVFQRSNPIQQLGDAVVDLASKPAELWNETQQQLATWWDHSAIKQVIGSGEGFPASLLNPLTQGEPTCDPGEAVLGTEFELTIRGGATEFYDGARVIFGGATLPDVTTVDSRTLRVTIPSHLNRFEDSIPVFVVYENGQLVSCGEVDVKDSEVFARFEEAIDPGPVFASWKALEAGSAANALMPGALNIAQKAVQALDNVGLLAGEAGNAAIGGLNRAGDIITGTLNNAANVADQVDDTVEQVFHEMGQLSAATMVIPPEKGGIHQLSFALGQGLSLDALNAPFVEDDMAVFCVFLCAAAPDIPSVYASLRRFGATYGIRGLEVVGL